MSLLTASYEYQEFVKFLLRSYNGILPPWLNGYKPGYALHHLRYQEKCDSKNALIADTPSNRKNFKEYIRLLLSDSLVKPKEKDTKRKLEKEIDDLVFIPVWYHNAIHTGKVPKPSTNGECFDAIREIAHNQQALQKLKQFSPGNTVEALRGLLELAKTLGQHCPRLSSISSAINTIREKMLDAMANL